MNDIQSPFAWQGTASTLGKDKAFNGVHKAISDRAVAASKKALILNSVRPITVYGHAVLAKTSKQFKTPI